MCAGSGVWHTSPSSAESGEDIAMIAMANRRPGVTLKFSSPEVPGAAEEAIPNAGGHVAVSASPFNFQSISVMIFNNDT